MTNPAEAAGSPVAEKVVAEALSWIGTPYRHQGSAKGIGCDCLGLVRGVWRAIYGVECERPGPYAPDWAGGQEELLAGVRRHFGEERLSPPRPGDLLLVRWRPHLPARHAGILVAASCFVHAYEGGAAVTRSVLVPQWRRRVAAVFAFPGRERV